MPEFIKSAGVKRNLSGTEAMIRDILAAASGLYLLLAVLFYPEPILHRSLSFGLFYTIIFLSYNTPGKRIRDKIPFGDWILAGLSISVSIYIGLNLGRLLNRNEYFDAVTTLDIIFAILTLCLLTEGTRRVIGPWLPALTLIALAYLIFGHNIPGRFGHMKMSVGRMADSLFLTTNGIWGSTMGIATGKIMIFILFGALFRLSGAGDFLFAFVSRITGSMKGGIAKVAIISSAMFGMVSGGPLTNVTTTGSMTIPLMKRNGYGAEYAACVESCASVGGVFMPPIMGAVAFLMAEVIGMDYGQVITRAFLPAVTYFAALFLSADFYARKHRIEGQIEKTSEKFINLIGRGYNFFLPLGFLIFRLVTGRVVAKAGLETIALMLILAVFNKRKPLSFKMVYSALKASVNMGVMIIATLATCGVLVSIIHITGLAGKFSMYLTSISNISVVITLIVVMLTTLFLGLAMNTSSTYIIMAVLGAPIIINMGFEPLGVHMFLLFYSAMATITPPVAITSYAAAVIADANPMKVGFMSMKVGLVAYILPFVFIFNPAILMYGSVLDVILSVMWALAGTAVMSMGLEGWLFDRNIGYVVRGLLVITGIFMVQGQLLLSGIAVVALTLIIGYSLLFLGKNMGSQEVVDEKM